MRNVPEQPQQISSPPSPELVTLGPMFLRLPMSAEDDFLIALDAIESVMPIKGQGGVCRLRTRSGEDVLVRQSARQVIETIDRALSR